MSDTELRPCPCCSSKMVGFMKINKRSSRGHAYCMDCGIRTKTHYNDDDNNVKWKVFAAQDWNTRKPMERIVEQLEEQKKNYKWQYLGYENYHNDMNYNICKFIDKAIEIVRKGGTE